MTESASTRGSDVVVFLPGHSLDDLPEDLLEDQAAAVLEAWTAPWHPAVLNTAGLASWASIDLPWRREGDIVGLVPAGFAESFASGAAPPSDSRQQFLQVDDSLPIVDHLLEALGVIPEAQAVWQEELIQDFYTLGLATLLGKRLAHRMRADAETDLEHANFSNIVRDAAHSWRNEDEKVTRQRLSEAFGCLEILRDHFYPVECWCLDLILVTPTTIDGLSVELSQTTAAAVLADRETLRCLEKLPPRILTQLQQRFAAGTLSPVGSLSAGLPLAMQLPEHLANELAAGRQAWRQVAGVTPTIYAQQNGPVAPLLPQLLSQAGYQGVLWASFDGRQLPDPASSRFRWQDGLGSTEAVRPRLFDARCAAAILALPVSLSDAMDHDHTVVLMGCRHAGTASPWFDMFRRLASWTNLFGRFCTPETFLEETDHLAEAVRFDRDAFPIRMTPLTSLPGQKVSAAAEPLVTQALQLVADAKTVMKTQRELVATLTAAGCSSEVDVSSVSQPALKPAGPNPLNWLGSWWPASRRDEDLHTLSAEGLQLRVHPGTGGIVSLRRGPEGRNRLSQQLAVRWSDMTARTSWQTSRPTYSAMVADSIERVDGTLVSRGHLVDSEGECLADFVQKVCLDSEGPSVILEGTVNLTAQPAGLPVGDEDPWNQFLACRFAWNENDFCDVHRRVQTQSVETERHRIFSPWLVSLASEGGGLIRGGGTHAADAYSSRLQLFTGGLPWHLQSSPHTLDTLLTTDLTARQLEYRFAIGLDIAHEVERAVCWAAEGSLVLKPMPLQLPTGTRLVHAEQCVDEEGLVGLRLRLLESDGQSRLLRVVCGQPVCRAQCVGKSASTHGTQTNLVVTGDVVEYSLVSYELVDLEIWFGNDHHP